MMKGMEHLMKQAQKMQKELAKVQEEMSNKEYEATAGGDMVVAKVNGKNKILSVKISKEVVDPEDIEMLEDLVVSAVNAALDKVQEEMKSGLKDVTGGMNIPGLGNLF